MAAAFSLFQRAMLLPLMALQLAAPLLLVCLAMTADGYAQNDSMTFVTRGDRRVAPLGLRAVVTYASVRVVGNVNVSITSSAPSPADRNLTVVLYTKSPYELGMAYRKQVTLPEGSSQVFVDIPFLAQEEQMGWDVELFEDGRNIEDTRNKSQARYADYQWMARNKTPSFSTGILTGESENRETIRTIFVDQLGAGDMTPAPDAIMRIANAPTDWRRYLGFPMWSITATGFRELCNNQPAIAEALRTYVGSGGKLLVYAAELPADKAAIEDFLSQSASARELLRKNWTLTEKVDLSTTWQPETTQQSTYLQGMGMSGLSSAEVFEAEQIELFGKQEEAVKKVTMDLEQLPYLNGRVHVTSGEAVTLPGLVVSRLYSAQSISSETPIQTSADGDWFWRNMILAVGKPPVLAFCIMVTLFGAILGPGLLYFTGRLKRRSLMILLVPSISILATLSILVYGVLYEGFGTYSRTTSVQFIDPDGNGFAWSRQSYFSGLPPRDGLKFQPDTFVRPVREPNDYNYGNYDPHSPDTVIELGDEQRWRGWLQARQQQQILVGHQLTDASLPVRIEALENDAIRITNTSSDLLPVVIVRGTGNNYYSAGPINAGDSVDAEPSDMISAGAAAARLSAPYRPQVPDDLLSLGNSNNFGWVRSYWSSGGAPDDVIQRAFKSYLSDNIALPEFGVVAVAVQSEQIEQPLDGSANNDMHLIIGAQEW